MHARRTRIGDARTVLAAMAEATAGFSGADSDSLTLFAALERTLINQLFVIPLAYYPLFFIVTGLAYGQRVQQMKERASSLFLPLWRRNLAFWLPVQFCQFAFVDPVLQLPFVCVAGLFWNLILSAVSLAQDAKAAGAVAGKVGAYWSAKWDALANSDAVRDAAPLMSSAVNVAIAGVLLRLALPRIAALQAVGGFDELQIERLRAHAAEPTLKRRKQLLPR